MKTIAVFTGGGETQALNATLAGVIDASQKEGLRILGGIRGWESLLSGTLIDISEVAPEKLVDIGGTFLKTSRTNPFREKGGVEKIKKTIERYGIDALIAVRLSVSQRNTISRSSAYLRR